MEQVEEIKCVHGLRLDSSLFKLEKKKSAWTQLNIVSILFVGEAVIVVIFFVNALYDLLPV